MNSKSLKVGTRLVWGPLSALGLVLALMTLALDQAHKWWMLEIYNIAQHEPVQVLPVLDLVLVWNKGVSYGWFSSHASQAQWLLAALSVAVAAFLTRWLARTSSPFIAAALGLIIGGALANALDRVIHGAVADFFHFHLAGFSWYVFNLADVAIVAGVGLLLYESLADGGRTESGHGNARKPRQNGSRVGRETKGHP